MKNNIPSLKEILLISLTIFGVWLSYKQLWTNPNCHPYANLTALFIYIAVSTIPFLFIAHAIKMYGKRNGWNTTLVTWVFRLPALNFITSIVLAIVFWLI